MLLSVIQMMGKTWDWTVIHNVNCSSADTSELIIFKTNQFKEMLHPPRTTDLITASFSPTLA